MDLSRQKKDAMKNSGKNATLIPTFKPIDNFRFNKSQDPELFALANEQAAADCLETRAYLKQILLSELRRRQAGKTGTGDTPSMN